MAQTNVAEVLRAAHAVTRVPKLKALTTVDNVRTGMWITLEDSTALGDDMYPLFIPAGTIISEPLCGGWSGALNCNYSGRKTQDGVGISYRM